MLDRTKQDANKIAYIVECYPEKTLDEIVQLIALPQIDVNAGIWAAIELGLLSEPDPETRLISVLKKADHKKFGKDVDELRTQLLYAFGKLGNKESDLEEFYLGQWTAGYRPHDVMVAVRTLIDEGKLASYPVKDLNQLDDEKNPVLYTFYTLPENVGNEWYLKNFKQDPRVKTDTASEVEADVENEAVPGVQKADDLPSIDEPEV